MSLRKTHSCLHLPWWEQQDLGKTGFWVIRNENSHLSDRSACQSKHVTATEATCRVVSLLHSLQGASFEIWRPCGSSPPRSSCIPPVSCDQPLFVWLDRKSVV